MVISHGKHIKSGPLKTCVNCYVGHAFEANKCWSINKITTGIEPIFYAILKRVYFKFRGLDLWGHIRPRIIAKTGLYFIAAGL